MARMAVVGCEGSGKTVFMAALADHYRPGSGCGVCLVPENAAANRFEAFQRRQMRALRQWPPATNPGKTVRLDWSLRRGGDVLVEIGMLEFGGETFRAAFRGEGGEESRTNAVNELVEYLSDADIVVVLVSIRDLMLDQRNMSAEEFERDAEALWVTRGILDFVAKERPSAGVIIGLTRADQYRAELDAAGGAAALFAARWPTVGAAAAKIPVVEVASVSAVDENGLPAEGFVTDGVLPAMRMVSKMRYGDLDAILADLSSLRSELERPASARSFGVYADVLRRFSGRLSDLKAVAAISGADVSRETGDMEAALERFRGVEEILSREESRRRERRLHPPVRRRFLVALLVASALLAASQAFPIDDLVAKLAERIERSRWTVAGPTSASDPSAAAAAAPQEAAETVCTSGNAPSAAEDDVLPAPEPQDEDSAAESPAEEPPAPDPAPAPPAEQPAPETPPAEITAPVESAETPASETPPAEGPAPEPTPVKPAQETPSANPVLVVGPAAPDKVDKVLATFSNRLERANAGDVKCKRWLGNQYYKGTDAAPRDLAAARRWYREAAEGGDVRAQACLASMCERGEGGPLLPMEATSWYRKAAEGGFGEAMFRLGVNLWEGAVADPAAAREAYDWLVKAKAAGCRNEDLDAWIRKASRSR